MRKQKPKKLDVDKTIKPLQPEQLDGVNGGTNCTIGPPRPSVLSTVRNCCW